MKVTSDNAFHTGPIRALSLADGNKLFSASLDGSIKMYAINQEMGTLSLEGSNNIGDPVHQVASFGSAVIWATESIPIEDDGSSTGVTVGIVTLLLNPAELRTIVCKVIFMF